MPSPRLFEAFVKRCAEHGIRVSASDDPFDTFMVIQMKMLDYIETARSGILIAKSMEPMIEIAKK